MRTRERSTELVIWGALSLLGGMVAAWIDTSAANVQGPVLVLMIINFALTLPGRAPVAVVAVGTWLALPILYAFRMHDVNPGMAIALVPAFIAAAGGRIAGTRLDTAAAGLTDVQADSDQPWHMRPLSTRFLLAVALIGIAAIPNPSIARVLGSAGARAPSWLAVVWQIMTLLGWIGFAPIILHQRLLLSPNDDVSPGIRPAELLVHVVVVGALAVIHAAVVVTLTGSLLIPLEPSWPQLVRFAFNIYLPLDCLAYVTILALGFASDVERHRRNAAQREAALKAESLESRLSALRARLNPHFLFNALNSVNVLAQADKPAETVRLVEGLTALLRYVLDERRASVPLREELEFAQEYLDVQRVRFGDRLRVQIDHDPSLDLVLVPQLVLQPVIENAVEHGIAQALSGGNVTLETVSDGDTLRLTVDNDGPSAPTDEPAGGIGLTNTRERLRRLYGDRGRLTLARLSPEGGTRVVVSLPLETAPSTE